MNKKYGKYGMWLACTLVVGMCMTGSGKAENLVGNTLKNITEKRWKIHHFQLMVRISTCFGRRLRKCRQRELRSRIIIFT